MKTDFVGMKVCKTRCTECLYDKNRVVSGQMAAGILRECKDELKFFMCHKHDDVMCRGFYDANPDHPVIQITIAMSRIHERDFFLFVEADKRTGGLDV